VSAAQARLRTLHSAAHYSPTNSTQALTGLTRAFKCAVDASAPDSQLTGDVSDLFALLKETNRILSLRPSSGLPTLVLPLRLCFGDAPRCRSSIISRSNWAIAANMLSIRRPVAPRVSTAFPLKSRIRSATPLASSLSTNSERCRADRANRSSFVTTNVSPSRQ
jgi:hypothetical protein